MTQSEVICITVYGKFFTGVTPEEADKRGETNLKANGNTFYPNNQGSHNLDIERASCKHDLSPQKYRNPVHIPTALGLRSQGPNANGKMEEVFIIQSANGEF